MNLHERIDIDPAVCGGRPRIKGTRLTVEFLLGLKAAGWSEPLILESYPHITDDDLRAVFAFVHALLEEDKYVSFPKVA